MVMAFRRPNCLHSDAGEPLLSELATWSGKRRSTDEEFVQGHGLVSDRGKRTGICNAGPGTPRELGLSLELWPPENTEGEGDLPIPQSYESLSEAKQDERESRGSVCWDHVERPGFPADEKRETQDFVPQPTVKSADIMKQLTIQEVRGTSRHHSQESWITELSGIWANAEAGHSWRGALSATSLETVQGCAAPLHQLSGPEVGLAWENPKTAPESRMMGSADAQWPSSNPESSDKFSERPLMGVSICPREGGQARSCSPREPEDPARNMSVHSWENFLHMPGPLPTSAPQGLASAMDKQASGELEASSCNQMQSMLWGEGGRGPSYLGAASAAAAAGLPRATPRVKTIQEMESFGGGSKDTTDRTFPSWGQRLRDDSLEPVTSPPISRVRRSKRDSLLPLEHQQPKHSRTEKREMPNMPETTWKSQAVANQDNDWKGVAVPQAQLPTYRPGTPSLHVSSGESRSCDPNIRAHQLLGISQRFDLFHGGLMPRSPVLYDEQDPPVPSPVPERPEQPFGEWDCPRCVALQNEIQALKQQLAILHSLRYKFQDLCSER